MAVVLQPTKLEPWLQERMTAIRQTVTTLHLAVDTYAEQVKAVESQLKDLCVRPCEVTAKEFKGTPRVIGLNWNGERVQVFIVAVAGQGRSPVNWSECTREDKLAAFPMLAVLLDEILKRLTEGK